MKAQFAMANPCALTDVLHLSPKELFVGIVVVLCTNAVAVVALPEGRKLARRL